MRLASAIQLDEVVEVPKPVRFVFILLGPCDAGIDYHQVGRAMATLLSNEVTHIVNIPYVILS